MKITYLFIIALTSLAFLASASQKKDKPLGFGTVNHVVVIGLDGFGEQYMMNFTESIPNIKSLIDGGTITQHLRDRYPVFSGPNWSTLFTGLTPEQTGIYTNYWSDSDTSPQNILEDTLPPVTGEGNIPSTIWEVIKEQKPDYVTAGSTSWNWISENFFNDFMDYSYAGNSNDQTTTQNAIDYISQHKPNFLFVHIGDIDLAGHFTYWGSPTYYQAAVTTDGYVGQIIKAIEDAGISDDTLIIVTADHGGYGNVHGDFNEANIYIPGIFYGPNIKAGQVSRFHYEINDFAPTILNALGLKSGIYMDGNVIQDLYRDHSEQDEFIELFKTLAQYS